MTFLKTHCPLPTWPPLESGKLFFWLLDLIVHLPPHQSQSVHKGWRGADESVWVIEVKGGRDLGSFEVFMFWVWTMEVRAKRVSTWLSSTQELGSEKGLETRESKRTHEESAMNPVRPKKRTGS